MAKRYSIDTVDGVTRVRFLEVPGFDDLRDAIDDVADTDPNRLRLWDLSCGFNLTSSQLRGIAEYGKSKAFPPSRVAILAAQDLSFGLARMYEVFREEDLVETRVFRGEEEALAWLEGRRE